MILQSLRLYMTCPGKVVYHFDPIGLSHLTSVYTPLRHIRNTHTHTYLYIRMNIYVLCRYIINIYISTGLFKTIFVFFE